jgi:hypothetical protein
MATVTNQTMRDITLPTGHVLPRMVGEAKTAVTMDNETINSPWMACVRTLAAIGDLTFALDPEPTEPTAKPKKG